MIRRFAAAGLVLAVVGLTLGARLADRAAADEMARAAAAFLTALSEEQVARARFALESPERTRWHFFPPEMFPRGGVPLKELTDAQARAAHALLKSGLSQRGYRTAEQIMALERVLKELERSDRFARDAGAYYVTVFGTPRAGGSWAWRFEGHHLSLHFTVVDGAVTVSAPTFLGANPARIREGPRSGERALAVAEDAAFSLLESLDSTQHTTAVLSDSAPSDILTGVTLPAAPLAPVGLSAGRMTAGQQSLLRDLVRAHSDVMNAQVAAVRWRRLTAAGFDRIAFAWAGTLRRGGPHYYRIQGPTFLIEYDNTQNDANHVHTVWRDFDGDFGRDLLREHLRSVRH